MLRKFLEILFDNKKQTEKTITIEDKEAFSREVAENVVESITKGADKMWEDHHNSANYPEYQRAYYILSREFPKLNTDEDFEKFEYEMQDIFDELIEKYKDADFVESEKKLQFYDENYHFDLRDSYAKLLRKLAGKYKKDKNNKKAYDLYRDIFHLAGKDIINHEEDIKIMRATDFKFLHKMNPKYGDERTGRLISNIEEIFVQLKKQEEIEEQEMSDRIHQEHIEELFQRFSRVKILKNSLCDHSRGKFENKSFTMEQAKNLRPEDLCNICGNAITFVGDDDYRIYN